MKKALKITVGFFSAALLTFAPVGSANAADAGYSSSGNRNTELVVRASQIRDMGAYHVIQSALDTARYAASADNVYKVTIEPGTYELSRALHIYSNTYLVLNDVTLVRNGNAGSNMLRTGEYDTASVGSTGYDAHSNITIEGGTFDGGGTSNTMLKVAHAKNFTLRNCEMKNVHNAHMMEIAGVDGFKVQGCHFENQLLDKDGVGYEVIQLDILKNGHIVQCRSEALPMKRVLIENCSFSDVPRGIGSHTAILNAPFDNITIRNNTFSNLGSVAIQGLNWKNCTISGNTIENTPRGIALYASFEQGSGIFRSSVLAKEGETKTDIPENYQRAICSNIVIDDNKITGCGNVEDIYADYESAAIALTGKKFTSAVPVNEDGSGGIPAGDYYMTGVRISGNSIESKGNGIKLSDTSMAEISNNYVRCGKYEFNDDKYHGISVINDSVVTTVKECDIEGSKYSGIYLDKSMALTVQDCRVANSTADAIQLNNGSKTNEVTGNYISGTNDCGVSAMSGSTIGQVANNTIREYKYKPVFAAKNAKLSAGNNFNAAAEVSSVTLNTNELTLGLGESYPLTVSAAPATAKTCYLWSSSDTDVVEAASDGTIKAVGKGRAEVTVRSGNGLSATCSVMVKNKPESIALNRNMLTLGIGEQFDLNCTITEGSASARTYYSSNNENVVSVERAGGLVTAKALGTATVAVKTYNDIPASCNVIVKKAPSYVRLDKTDLHIGVGQRVKLNATIPEESASALRFASSDESVIRTDQKGNLFAVTKGSATVTVSTYNGLSASCHITVSNAADAIRLDAVSLMLEVGETRLLTYNLENGMAGVEFKSSDPNVCKVDPSTGEITAKTSGGVLITATTHNGKTDTCEVKVN